MESYQIHVLQSHRRALRWCEANPDVVPPPDGPPESWSPITRQYDELRILTDAVEAGATQQAVQTSLASPEGTGEPALREALCGKMRHVAGVAQALKTTVPGIGMLKMPADRIENEKLVHFATALLQRATTYEGVLVENAVPRDFIIGMQTAISALRTNIDKRGVARAKRVAATNEIAETLDLAKSQVIYLDVGITERLRDDSPRLAGWRNTKRVSMRGLIRPRP